MFNTLSTIDPLVHAIILQEQLRLESELSLIASENYASPAVMAATGSVLTNKYAEGYPGKRYYAGCNVVDEVETLAIDRCKTLFGAAHANVQPHAGSQANMAAYYAMIKPGDTILGMSLSEGGHLTHGSPVNFSGSLYNCVFYTVNRETGLLDYDDIEQLATLHKPKLIIAGASAYSRIIDFARFAAIAKKVGAYFMADIAHIAGLIAAGIHPSPVGHADCITSTTHKTLRGPRGGLIMCTEQLAQAIDKAVFPGTQGGPFMNSIAAKAVAFHEALQPEFITYSKQIVANAQAMVATLKELGYTIVADGTDNHLFIIDLRSHNITGKTAQEALAFAGIIASRSCIPFDPQKPWITSGIRLGTPAITTRGMKETEASQIAHLVDEILKNHANTPRLLALKEEVARLGASFPIYQQ